MLWRGVIRRRSWDLIVGVAILAAGWAPTVSAFIAIGITGVSATPSPAPVGTAVTITVSGIGTCATVTVNFGDGTSVTLAGAAFPRQTTHTYSSSGTFTILATGTACPGRASTTLTVGAGPGSGLTSVTVVPSPGLVRTPVAVLVEGRGTCPVNVDFGDGATRGVTGKLPLPVSHTYTTAGTFTVTATAVAPCAGAASTTVTVTTGPTAPFSLRRVELRFENGRGEITVPKDAARLTAFADILYNGTGLLIAAWEVDGRTLTIIHEFLTFGASTTLRTPEVPPLPTFEPGRHELSFRVLQPPGTFTAQAGVSRSPAPGILTIPTIAYYVEAAPAAPASIELVSPADGAALPQSSVIFRWRSVPGVASYHLEIVQVGQPTAVFSALTRETAYTLPELYHRLFRAGGTYTWRVIGLDEEGRTIAESSSRTFTWQPEARK